MTNKLLDRYLSMQVEADLENKMVFVGGPLQVGKTTLSLSFLDPPTSRNPAYLNWDDATVRRSLLRGELLGNKNLVVLDEMHKHSRWRNLVKGFYDTRRDEVSFLITGSARLDHYRKGGDSLQGRYHYYRLHPFSLCEMNSNPTNSDVDMLLKFGGFPEPLLSNNTRVWRRWQRERLSRVVYEDLRDLENILQIDLIEVLLEALPDVLVLPFQFVICGKACSSHMNQLSDGFPFWKTYTSVFEFVLFGHLEFVQSKRRRNSISGTGRKYPTKDLDLKTWLLANY